MADINPSIPVTGQPNSSEEPKIVTALSQLVATVNNLDTANLADGAVTAVKIEAQQAWQTITLPAGLSSGSLAYYKDSLGVVRFRGDAFAGASPAVTVGATICTLPVGYRPGTTHNGAIIHVGTGSIFPISISTTGLMSLGLSLASTGSYFFEQLSYRAEN